MADCWCMEFFLDTNNAFKNILIAIALKEKQSHVICYSYHSTNRSVVWMQGSHIVMSP